MPLFGSSSSAKKEEKTERKQVDMRKTGGEVDLIAYSLVLSFPGGGSLVKSQRPPCVVGRDSLIRKSTPPYALSPFVLG